MTYFYLKAFHIISLVAWFAAMFYLPRLFVYHMENIKNNDFIFTIKIMERRLYKYIGLPAFWATFITGGLLIWQNLSIFSTGGWLHLKILLVIFLGGYFFHLGALNRSLAKDECKKSSKFFRVYNEVPTLFLIAIVILAVVKPF